MNMTQEEIDALYADDAFTPVPAADYNAVITAAAPTVSANSGLTYCKIESTITDGEHAGRIIDDIINFNNPHSFCISSTKKAKTQLYLATGLTLDFASPLALIGKSVTLGVKIKKAKADDQYGDKNEVRYYKPPTAQAAPAPLPQMQQPQQPMQQQPPMQQQQQPVQQPQQMPVQQQPMQPENPFLAQQQQMG